MEYAGGERLQNKHAHHHGQHLPRLACGNQFFHKRDFIFSIVVTALGACFGMGLFLHIMIIYKLICSLI
jgi:hypothetical protein